ncbi:TetR/AcrR family transcriptional regulator [Mesorhizobium australicum]|uniref:TetR/AcrR family transcriptional regulator n=1 Tax=Mesorhizobium australicum TaxID=536018 RepID=UPI00333C6A2B
MAGRPREFDRAEALAKARDAFWSRGYEGVSMSDLVSALGLASARIYAAFGSKEHLFREAIALYEASEGGFASIALDADTDVRTAMASMLRDAAALYTRPGKPRGCMVVAAATNCSLENEDVLKWLASHRRSRTQSIIKRLRRAAAEGELKHGTDTEILGDHIAAVLHGLSVQARDGVSRKRLLALIEPALTALDAAYVPRQPAAMGNA